MRSSASRRVSLVAGLLALLVLSGCQPPFRVGEIGGRKLVKVPRLKSKDFGRSKGAPIVLEIEVREEGGPPGDVGALVKEALFPDHPPFTFNVAFACAKPRLRRPSRYGDPYSIWFNVFYGCYEITVDKEVWGRPFGYMLPRLDIGQPRVLLDEVARIGKADWNYFSNYLYGVPLEACARYDSLPKDLHDSHPVDWRPRVRIGKRGWDLIEIRDVQVVTAYTPNPRTLRRNVPIVSALWRESFGWPTPRPGHNESFPPARMRGRFYMCFQEGTKKGRAVYRTYFFGGTANEGFPDGGRNDRFLAAQLATMASLIKRKFSHLGFPIEE